MKHINPKTAIAGKNVKSNYIFLSISCSLKDPKDLDKICYRMGGFFYLLMCITLIICDCSGIWREIHLRNLKDLAQ